MNLNNEKIVIKTVTFERLESFFLNHSSDLNWNCLFVLPQWLNAWWDTFGENQNPEILVGYREEKLIGLAPLCIQETTARFIGGENVCDYQDIITASNHLNDFLISILTYLKNKGVRSLQLGTLRPDSVSLTRLPNLAKHMGYDVESHQTAFSYEITLPRTWESYLYMLNGKQRHEIRRKIRRLNEAGHVQFHVLKGWNEISDAMDTFFTLFKASRPDKSEFLSEQMMSFFRLLAQRTARQGFLKMFFLNIDLVPAAGVMCFDYKDTLFLYNNGYNPQFSRLSPGFLSKVYSIRYSIEQGKRCYDLLKGEEGYKKRLGSNPVPLYRLKIYFDK
jgi:CelD/BcsL family acetyltransferase involved in cellulose biosynthesis